MAGAGVAVGESMSQMAARAGADGSGPIDARSDAQGRFTVQGPAEGYLVVSNSEGTSATARAYRCEATAESLSIIIRLESHSEGKPIGDDEPYLMVETMPRFNGGGIQDFRSWVQAQVRYPEEAMKKGLQGRVVMQFVVETDGSLNEFSTLQTPSAILSEEVIRILKKSPQWMPGMQDGKPVRVKFAIPIEFQLQGLPAAEPDKPAATAAGSVEEVVVVGYGSLHK